MAAPTDTGLVENVELDKGLGLSADDPIGFDEKNGGEEEEVQVAKKPRVEKAENGDAAAAAEFGVGDGEELVKKDANTPDLEALNGNESEERPNGEGDDEEDSVGAVAEDADDVEPAAAEDHSEAVTTGKDASSGDVGLRTLLQEGDTPKASVVNGTEDASHLFNGAK